MKLPPYPDLSEPRLVATRQSAARYQDITSGVLNDGKFPGDFEGATAFRWVDHSEEGWFRFLAWSGTSAQKLFEAGLGELYGYRLACAGTTAETVQQSLDAHKGAAYGRTVKATKVWAGYRAGGGTGGPPKPKRKAKKRKG